MLVAAQELCNCSSYALLGLDTPCLKCCGETVLGATCQLVEVRYSDAYTVAVAALGVLDACIFSDCSGQCVLDGGLEFCVFHSDSPFPGVGGGLQFYDCNNICTVAVAAEDYFIFGLFPYPVSILYTKSECLSSVFNTKHSDSEQFV